jgi:5,10-methylenetetrahydromethanopterin reductase
VGIGTGVWFFPDATAPKILETIVAAEACGLDEVWLGDEGPARDPFVLLAAAAPATRRIRLGVGVTNPYLRHPATTAATALTIHELSGGRMVLGIGPGGRMALDPAHIDRVAPLAATRRAVRIMRAVAHGDPTEGYTPAPHAVTAPDLPIYVGARGEQLNRFASEAADGVFLGGVPGIRLAPTVGWARSRRPIAVAAYLSAVFTPEVREAVRPRMIYALLDAPPATRQALGVDVARARRAAAALAKDDAWPARQLIDDRLLDELLLCGSPEDVGHGVARRIRGLEPTSIGLALLTDDPLGTLEPAATALAVARQDLS